MKRIVSTFLFTVFLISLSQAQDDQSNENKTEFGFKAGVNLSYMFHKFGPGENNINNTGFYLGSAVNIPLGEKLSVQPEIIFASTNYSVT